MEQIYRIPEIQKKLHPVFEQAPVYRAVLFGSYAKGQATERSDIDIVIDGRGELRGLGFFGVLEDMTQALNKRVDLIELSEIRSGSPLLEEIRRTGVVLYER